jgi:transposase
MRFSYRKGQCYLIVVVDHDTGRLVWAGPGRDAATLGRFFELLGKERCAAILLVSADMGSWIARAVRTHCPNAELCLDPFHIVKVRHEAPCGPSGGARPPPPSCRSSPVKLRAA